MTDTTQVLIDALQYCKRRAELMRTWTGQGWHYHLSDAKNIYNKTEEALAAVKAGQEEQELSDEEERKAFENWFTGGDFELKRLGDSYALSSAHNNWQAWKARSARSRTDSIIVEAKG
jgi:hypothetical protein